MKYIDTANVYLLADEIHIPIGPINCIKTKNITQALLEIFFDFLCPVCTARSQLGAFVFKLCEFFFFLHGRGIATPFC